MTNATVLTMDQQRSIIEDGAVAIREDRIVDVGAGRELRSRWSARKEMDARGGIVTPGLINAHQHVTGGPLAWSCIPDNLVPGTSIFEWAVPMHATELASDHEISARLVAASCMRSGTTTLVEPGTVTEPRFVASGLCDVGIRSKVGVWAWDIEDGPFTAPTAEVLERIEGVLEEFPPGGMAEGFVTLIGHSLASDDLLVGAAELARRAGVAMTMHLSPTSSDPEVYLERHGCRPVVHLANLGVLGKHLLIGHGVWLDDEEVDAVLASQSAIAYCPWAYLRLGQGVTGHGRHAEIFRRGGRIALGCDSTNAGDTVDVLRTAALAAGLAKDQRVDPTWFGAHEALEMATIAGAEAIGMDDLIGSLEVGKKADVVVFDWRSPQTASRSDPALALVWSSDGRNVRHVIVDGRVTVEEGRCTTVDEEAIQLEASKASRELLERAGLDVPTRWPRIRPG